MTTMLTNSIRTPSVAPIAEHPYRTLRIGLFGFGVVGGGIVEILREKKNEFRRLFKTDVVIPAVCVKDVSKERSVALNDDVLLTDDADKLLGDDSLDVIIEVIGGYDDAKSIILSALYHGKNVITANKYLLSRDIVELRRVAERNDAELRYAASVCGSVPVLRAVSELREQDTIRSIRGIVNGSTNFILTLLAEQGTTVKFAMNEARRLGFLEADPTLDISGADAAQKLSVLIYHAFGEHIPTEHIRTIGIDTVTKEHIDSARVEHSVIKLIAGAYRHPRTGEIVASVEPERIPKTHLFAHTSNEFNALEVIASNAGPQLLYGKGAGSLPTASAVISDLVTIMR